MRYYFIAIAFLLILQASRELKQTFWKKKRAIAKDFFLSHVMMNFAAYIYIYIYVCHIHMNIYMQCMNVVIHSCMNVYVIYIFSFS